MFPPFASKGLEHRVKIVICWVAQHFRTGFHLSIFTHEMLSSWCIINYWRIARGSLFSFFCYIFSIFSSIASSALFTAGKLEYNSILFVLVVTYFKIVSPFFDTPWLVFIEQQFYLRPFFRFISISAKAVC